MKKKTRQLNGRELANDLAQHIQSDLWMAWTEIPLGSISSPQADVVAILKSFAHIRFLIYEIKVSRSDFLRDANSGKYTKYLQHCTQFYFACYKDLVKKEEVPVGCGLILKGENGWRVAKAARRNDFKPSTDLLLKLLMKGYENYLIKARELDRDRLTKNANLKGHAQRLGIKVAYELANADEFVAETKLLQKTIGELLGISFDSFYSAADGLKREIEHMSNRRRYMKEALELATQLDTLWRGNQHGLKAVPQRIRDIAERVQEKVDAIPHKDTL